MLIISFLSTHNRAHQFLRIGSAIEILKGIINTLSDTIEQQNGDDRISKPAQIEAYIWYIATHVTHTHTQTYIIY